MGGPVSAPAGPPFMAQSPWEAISKVEFKRTGPKFESLSPPLPPREVTFLGIGYLPNISESQ